MFKVKMKKIRVIFLRAQQEDFLRKLVLLGCIDVLSNDELLEEAELSAVAAPENLSLEQYHANKEFLTASATESTLMITGWLPADLEPEALTALSDCAFAWETQDPTPDELAKVPVKLMLPKITGFFFRGTGRAYSPVAEEPTPEPPATDESSPEQPPEIPSEATVTEELPEEAIVTEEPPEEPTPEPPATDEQEPANE